MEPEIGNEWVAALAPSTGCGDDGQLQPLRLLRVAVLRASGHAAGPLGLRWREWGLLPEAVCFRFKDQSLDLGWSHRKILSLSSSAKSFSQNKVVFTSAGIRTRASEGHYSTFCVHDPTSDWKLQARTACSCKRAATSKKNCPTSESYNAHNHKHAHFNGIFLLPTQKEATLKAACFTHWFVNTVSVPTRWGDGDTINRKNNQHGGTTLVVLTSCFLFSCF